MLTTSASLKVVYLVAMLCTGDPRDQNCGDEFVPESWTASTQAVAKEECERFLRDEFDPKNYYNMPEDGYVAVRCE